MLEERYRGIFSAAVGDPHVESGLPVPWFARNVWDKVQWAAYIGNCGGPNALAFGINVEFLPTWRKIRPRLTLASLSDTLTQIQDDEWHWVGRPGYVCRNPEVLPLYATQPVADIDLAEWLGDLDEILEGRRMWRSGRPMRPQLQIVRRVGNNSLGQDIGDVRGAVRQAMFDMQPLMNLLSNRR